MLFTPVGALLAKPDPVHLMKPQTGLMEGKEGKQKEKCQSYTQSSLLFLSVWRKWIPTKVQRHRHASLYLTFSSSTQWVRWGGWGEMEKEIFNYRWICARRRREASSDEAVAMPKNQEDHTCMQRHIHTHKRRQSKQGGGWVEAGVSERCYWGWPQHTNSSDSTHTHTHRQCTQAELTARDGRAR